jgi:hypothetical protein
MAGNPRAACINAHSHPDPNSPAPTVHSPLCHARRNPNPTVAPLLLPLRRCRIWPSRRALLATGHHIRRCTSSTLVDSTPLPHTSSSRRRAPRRVIAFALHLVQAHMHLMVIAGSRFVNNDLHHCGFVPDDKDDNVEADGDSGPNT